MNKRRALRSDRERRKIRITIVCAVLVIAVIAVGLIRVAYIITVNGREYSIKTIENQILKIGDEKIKPNRGTITDRNNNPIALSTTVYNVILEVRIIDEYRTATEENYDEESERQMAIKQSRIERFNNTLNSLSNVLEIPIDEVKGYVEKNADGTLKNDTNWLIIKKHISYEQKKELENSNLIGVYFDTDTERSYPEKMLASQIIGYTGGDDNEGVAGIEYSYEDYLEGTYGRVFSTYEQDNTIQKSDIKPVQGNTVVTTIDKTIQEYAEQICKEAYEDCQPDHSAKNTAITVMNPNTGEIIAMAQYPTYDANSPMDSPTVITEARYKDKWDTMDESEKNKLINTCWRNFNVTDSFEPGSIFKPMVVAAAIEEGVISRTDSFYCGGRKVYGSDTIKCNLTSGHGSQSVAKVLANSCNVGMMEIVSKMGRDKFYKYQHDFGFGERTGIDLPAEASCASLLNSIDKLNTVELATGSFGQGFNCTSIQALTAFSAVINGGNLLKPYVMDKIVDENGNIVKENDTQVVRKVISQDTSDYFREILENVISSTGTGKKAVIDGYSIGGKTGTAQQGETRQEYVCTFIAYFPIENPQYIAMAVINHPENYTDGIVSPVPMLRELLVDIIKYKAIKPDHEVTNQEKSVNVGTQLTLPDFTGKSVSETISKLNEMGLSFDIGGSGGDTVESQFPTGNTVVTKEETVVNLFIKSTGKEVISVPELTGRTVEQAKEILKSQGFECISLANEGTIISQSPQAGIKIEKGTQVKVVTENETAVETENS